MRKTIKLQTASHARVCKEKGTRKNDCLSKYFVVEGSTLKNSDDTDSADFDYKNCLQHKGISTVL